ncbi:MAG TPA: DUF6537 domain-containing protein, partial [Parvularculaceae bacterium]|nr:DUF6537 domain-containing protein [Parvularculaceae bacterium]
KRYRQFVERVAAETTSIPGGDAFARAVAAYLFKLMAYKDEYEVARLHTDGAFRLKIADAFEGEYKVKFHMAPPIFNRGLDEQGRPRKTTFRPWMYGVLSLMRRFRFLRGTPLDLFGATGERKLERKLIADYRARIDSLLPRLNARNMEAAVAIARLPDDIRGYGPVKLESIEKAEAKLGDLMRQFEEASAASAA